MRAVDLGCMMVRSNCSQTRKKIEGELKNWNFNEPVTAHQCPTSFGVHAGMYCCLIDCVRSALAEYLGLDHPNQMVLRFNHIVADGAGAIWVP